MIINTREHKLISGARIINEDVDSIQICAPRFWFSDEIELFAQQTYWKKNGWKIVGCGLNCGELYDNDHYILVPR